MAALTDDNLHQIPYVQSNTTFFDWVNQYNTLVVNKLNNIKTFDGASGDGIVFTLGTTSPNDPLGGSTSGSDLIAGTFRCDIAEAIARGVTFQGDVSIDGTLNYDLTKNDLGAIKRRIFPAGGFTATLGFSLGNPIRIDDYGKQVPGASGTPEYYRARADNALSAEAFAVVSGVTWPTEGPYTSTNTYIEVTTSGRIKGDFSGACEYGGLSAGCIYFIDPGTSGGLTPFEPTIAGYVNKPMVLGVTADEGYVLNYRGQLLTGSGTGGTGGIDNNRMIVAPGSGHGIVRGDVVGFKADIGTNGWFKLTEDKHDYLSNAVGLCAESFTLDGVQYITIVSTGFEGDLPVDGNNTGLLYVGFNGRLVPESTMASVSDAKPFAIGWSSGGDGSGIVRGVIINQNHLGGGGGDGTNTTNAKSSNGNWAYRSSSIGGTTFGSAINENIMINGSFDVWQRGIGKSSYGMTGTTYFADRWVRVDGASGSGGGVTTGTYNIERKSFASNQTEVFGNPNYYIRTQNNLHPQGGGASGSFVLIENRIEDVRTLRGENATLSFWAKCGVTGSTADLVVSQYDGNSTVTTIPSTVQLGTLWTKYETAFRVPDITTTPTGKHYLGVGFDTKRLNTTFDLTKVKLERGIVATTNADSDVSKEYDDCKRYYQRSYSIDQTTATTTMLGTNDVPDTTAINATISPTKDIHHKFPVVMRGNPTVTLYSPSTGQTAEGYNQSAGLDLRLTVGTYGYNNMPRVSPAGASTITAQYATKDGIYIFVPNGSVVLDEVSVHYVANADLTDNMINPT